MDEEGHDLVMKLYWECQALQEKLSKLQENTGRKDVIVRFLEAMEAQYPDTVQEFSPEMLWYNVSSPLTIASLHGTLPLLDFFTYCCVNCHHILPDLAKLEEKWTGKGLVVIGVHSAKFDNEKEGEQVRHAVRKYGIHHPVCSDGDIVMWRGLGVTCWPTQLLLSPQGSPLYVAMGEGHGDWMEELVQVAVEHYGSMGRLNGTTPSIALEAEVSGSVLSYPGKVTVGGGKLVISDSGHHRVLVVDSSGGIHTVVGSGLPGWKDGSLAQAQFRGPQGVCVVGHNIVYVADTENHCIRKVDLESRTVVTVAGTGLQGTDKEGGQQGVSQAISSPWDLCLLNTEGGEALLVCMAGLHQLWLYCITDITWWKGAQYKGGTMVRIVGSGAEENRNNSYPAKAGFAQPSGVCSDIYWFYVADSESSTLRKVSRSDGAVKGLCGGEVDPTNLFAYGDKDGEGRGAKLQHPLGVALAHDGSTLYVADSYNHKVKKVVLMGNKAIVSTVIGGLCEPGGLCISEDGTKVFIADTNNHCIQVLELGTNTLSKLEVSMKQQEDSEIDKVTTSSYMVGRGEGIVTIKASTTATRGVKVNTEGSSKWTMTVDQVQGGWQFSPNGKLERNSDEEVVWSLQHPELPEKGAVVSLRIKLYVCNIDTAACMVRSIKHNITLLPSDEERDFLEFSIGNLLEL